MANPYVGEIRMFAGTYAPVSWMFCDGQHLQISQYEALYTAIGTTYGGDGQSTFALPDLRSRIPLGRSNSHVVGETGGVEQVTLTVAQIPSHSHALLASAAPATTGSPAGKVVATAPLTKHYVDADADGGADSPSALRALDAAGGSQPHENRQPSLCVSFIICVNGLFPTPS